MDAVEGKEARPQVVFDASNCVGGVWDQAPLILGNIDADFIKEILIVDSFISFENSDLVCLSNGSEVLIVVQRKCLCLIKSSEPLVKSCFFERSELQCSFGNDAARFVYAPDDMRESV